MTTLFRWVLPNGLTVLYRSSPSMPLVASTLLIKAGSTLDDPAQAGLASLTMDLLLSGTRRHSARQIADIIEFMGASIGAQSGEDYSEAGFTAPAAQWARALEILSDSLRHPSFPSEEIAKERAQTLASLKSRHDTIFALAHDRFSELLHGAHPYGRPVDGFPRTVVKLQREQMQAWHRAYVRPDRAIFSLVGPFPPLSGLRLIEKTLGRWQTSQGQASATPRFPCVGPEQSRREVLRSRFEQAYLMTGMLAPSVNDAGFMALKVLNTLLGGGMSSRLFLQLREELGLAYEVSSFFPTRLHASQWVLYMGLPKEKLALAEKKMEAILKQLERQGPTDAEMAQAKQMIAGAYLMEHQTRRRQGWYAAWWEFLGKGIDYDQRFLQEVQTVSRRDVHALLRRLLAQPRVTVTVVPKK